MNPWAVAVEDFRIFSLEQTVVHFKCTHEHKLDHTESKVASTKGQQSTVFRPWRYIYFNVASWSLYDTLRVRGSWFAGKEKKPLGIAESREKVRRRKSGVL